MPPPNARMAPAWRLRDGLYAEADHEKNEDTHAGNVLTDNVDETWNSGRMARPGSPVSLTIDLGGGQAGTYVDHIHLLPYQVPAQAKTRHRVYIDNNLVTEVATETRHHHALPPVQIGRMGRQLRVETIESPSWVAWSQVHVYGNRPGQQPQPTGN